MLKFSVWVGTIFGVGLLFEFVKLGSPAPLRGGLALTPRSKVLHLLCDFDEI